VKLLVMDSNLAGAAIIASDLCKASGCQALQATSEQAALMVVRQQLGAIGIVVFFLEGGPEAGLSFIRDVLELCQHAAIREPKFVVLTPGVLSSGYFNKFRAHGATWLLYGFPMQLAATVRAVVSQLISENGRPTFIVEHLTGTARFYLLGPADRELIPYGPRLTRIMNCFATNSNTELSTGRLAEGADITVQSVRVYLSRLRDGYDKTRAMLGVNVPGYKVFCTVRRDGAFVHVLKARVVFA
jgi:hypothetical protein